MTNPYQSPETKSEPRPYVALPARSLQHFCAWYFGAFIVSACLFFLSQHVRQFDLIEIPMATLLFPWGAVIDPRDGMVNHRDMFIYGMAWWAIMGGIAWSLRRRAPPLVIAGILELAVVVGAIAYAVYLHMTGAVIVCY